MKIKHVALEFNFVVALDFNFCQGTCGRQSIAGVEISNTYQRANVLTKALRPYQLKELKSKLIEVFNKFEEAY